MGVVGMAIPEEFGGLGFGFLELAVALEEAGRALLPSPLLGTSVLAVDAVLQAADPERAAELLPGIADGATLAAVARPRPVSQRPTAVHDGGEWHLDGDLGIVLDALRPRW